MNQTFLHSVQREERPTVVVTNVPRLAKPPVNAYHEGKVPFERIVAFLALVILSPIIALLAVVVKATSRGPAIFSQDRVGKDGRVFTMYKLRSMVVEAERDLGPVWSDGASDPRATSVGRFLRRSHLDELPQLLNVCRGEMSLVGPRPERPELVDELACAVDQYLTRLAVRPGITGLAQINLPPDTCVETVRSKVKLDIEYIDTADSWLDLRITFWTLLRIARVPASIATKWSGVHRDIDYASCDPQGPVVATRAIERYVSNK